MLGFLYLSFNFALRANKSLRNAGPGVPVDIAEMLTQLPVKSLSDQAQCRFILKLVIDNDTWMMIDIKKQSPKRLFFNDLMLNCIAIAASVQLEDLSLL